MTDTTYWNQRLQTGTASGSGVVVTHGLCSNFARLALTATPVVITKGASDGYGSLKIYDFPVGRIQIIDAHINLAITAAAGISATGTVDASLGTTATTNSTLSTTEINIVPVCSDTLIASEGTLQGAATPTEFAGGVFDGTTTAIDLILNFALAAGVSSNSTITCTGTVTVLWINHGNV